MDEHPHGNWLNPKPCYEHAVIFTNLVRLHALTHAWLTALEPDPAPRVDLSHRLKRVLSPAAAELLARLESFAEKSIPTEIETNPFGFDPQEFIRKMESTVWVTQAWIMRDIVEKTMPEERPALQNSLEQSSWNLGRRHGIEQWEHCETGVRSHLGSIILALAQSPLVPTLFRRNAFLVQRALADRVEAELLGCPHQSTFAEVAENGDELCRTHFHWMRGFVYALNSRVLCEYKARSSPGQQRCEFILRFHS